MQTTTEDFETAIRVVIVGNGNVGKSTLIRRFCKNQFNPTYKKTIGVEYQEREFQLPTASVQATGEQSVRFMLWDCAGQEEFNQITRDYYKEADAVILAFATTDKASFDMIKSWKSKIESVLSLQQLTVVLVQTKADLVQDPNAIDPKEAEALARELQIRFYRISTKDNVNVEDLFVHLAEAHVKKKDNSQKPAPRISSTTAQPNAELFQKDPVLKSPREDAVHTFQPIDRPTTQRTGGSKESCILS